MLTVFSACSSRQAISTGQAPKVYFDFLTNFSAAAIDPKPTRPAEEAGVRLFSFVRNHVRRQSFVTIANATARFAIPSIPAGAVLRGYLGMPFNLGDGALAELILEEKETRCLLLSRHMDPAHQRGDRDWIPWVVDLSPYVGKTATIIFSAKGTSGDLTGDWVGWAEPTISW